MSSDIQNVPDDCKTFCTEEDDLTPGMTDTPGNRLRMARIKAGFETPTDAARRFGWNENTYKSHENGARNFKRSMAMNYARAYRVSPIWLLDGVDAKVAAAIPVVITVPIIGIAAGGTFRSADYTPPDGASVSAMTYQGVKPEDQYALQVEGPSVNLEIQDGAFAICTPLEKYPGGPQHGDLVHLERHRAGLVETSIKEVRYGPSGVAFWPRSDHPDHQEPIRVDHHDDDATVYIKGVVIGTFKPMKRR